MSTADAGKIEIRITEPRRAKGPLQVLPTNPRYFTDGSGKALLLVGAHTWNNLQDWGTSIPPPMFDYQGYLKFLSNRGLNFFRLWAWEQASWVACPSDQVWFTPVPYVRTGPGIALDGEPKFDLHQFNPAYFQRLRDRVILAGSRGIYVSVMLFNGPSTAGAAWRGHPFNWQNNINGIDGDSDSDGDGKEIHSLKIPAVTRLQEEYIRQVINSVGDLANVLWEISNESHSESQDWQYRLIRFIKNYEKTRSKQHPVGMTVEYPDGSNQELFASSADWISPNDKESYKDDPPPSQGRKVIVSDTDHLWGVGGSQTWVWKSFLRGLNPILMDPYDATLVGPCPIYGDIQTKGGQKWSRGDPRWEEVRRSLGQIRFFSKRIDLTNMTPQGQLASSGYCLAKAGAQYLVFLPSKAAASRFEKFLWSFAGTPKQTVSVDLSGVSKPLNAEWFSPDRQVVFTGESVKGGAYREFTAPFAGDAVLYLSVEDTHS